MPTNPGKPLKILHVFRAPVGGLFRHVVDLARSQVARGHQVGLIADATTGGARAEAILADLASDLVLGLTRTPMSRHAGASDLGAVRHVAQRAAAIGADVLHGHGSKGGAYARLVRGRTIRVYTPHGGSLHYGWGSPAGFLYLTAERVLMARTDLFLFESAYGRDVFRAKVGIPRALVRVVHNGVTEAEFEPIMTAPDASDLVFVGELRMLKGIDVLLDAIARLAREGRAVTATIVGEGPDKADLLARGDVLNLTSAVHFAGALPARTAFARGRVLVVPSRAESLPYVVLEAAAAGLPMIATRVGGIPEIFGAETDLLPPGDPVALARVIATTLDNIAGAQASAAALRERVHACFSADVMTEAVLAAYAEAFAARHG